MKKTALLAAGLLLAGTGAAYGQSTGPQPATGAPVEQVQANPPGPGTTSDTPPNPETASSPVSRSMPADPGYQAGPYKGALSPPPAEAMNKTYPLCSRTIQDSCMNPSEAGGHRTAARRHIRRHARRH